jgi:putative endonuclease
MKTLEAPPWVVYILRCKDGSLYTGVAKDLSRRIKTHRAGRGGAYTRSHQPVRLVYQEPQSTRSQALIREAAIKKLPRLKKLALFILKRA